MLRYRYRNGSPKRSTFEGLHNFAKSSYNGYERVRSRSNRPDKVRRLPEVIRFQHDGRPIGTIVTSGRGFAGYHDTPGIDVPKGVQKWLHASLAEPKHVEREWAKSQPKQKRGRK